MSHGQFQDDDVCEGQVIRSCSSVLVKSSLSQKTDFRRKSDSTYEEPEKAAAEPMVMVRAATENFIFTTRRYRKIERKAFSADFIDF
jgi:hypothetical protein